jgi:hypothetical protein
MTPAKLAKALARITRLLMALKHVKSVAEMVLYYIHRFPLLSGKHQASAEQSAGAWPISQLRIAVAKMFVLKPTLPHKGNRKEERGKLSTGLSTGCG